MAIYDRYISLLFFRVLIVLFSAFCGLFMIVDFFERLEEFLKIAETEGSVFSVASEFYAPRILSFFDRTSGLVALIAGVFVLTWIRRNRELVALYAGGIHVRRVLRPILWCVIGVAIFGVVNREFLIPTYRDRLTRDTRNWFGKDEVTVHPTYDRMTGLFLNAKGAIFAKNEIIAPNFQLPPSINPPFARIVARKATYHLSENGRPPGYLLKGVTVPADLKAIPDVMLESDVLVMMPHDHDWLDEDSCYVTSRITVQDLTRKDSDAVYSSTAELIRDLRNPSRSYDSASRVLVHARMLQPFLDIALLFVGFSVVMANQSRGFFVSIGLSVLLVVFFLIVQFGAHMLGREGILSPELAAWIPIFVFVPLAYAGYGRLR